MAVVSIALLGWMPQQNAAASVAVEPSSLRLAVGEKATLSATVKDANGNFIEAEVFFFSRARRDLRVDTRSGEIEAVAPGEYEVVAIVPPEGARLSLRNLEDQVAASINVVVPQPPARSVSFVSAPSNFYAGTTVELEVSAVDAQGAERSDLNPTFTSSAPQVASVDARGSLRLRRAGRATITAAVDEVSADLAIDVAADPVATYALEASADTGRTGDVVHFNVVARDASGREVADLPVRFSVSGNTDSRIRGNGATALVEPDGRFVAERSGTYNVVAFSGKHVASARVTITRRTGSRTGTSGAQSGRRRLTFTSSVIIGRTTRRLVRSPGQSSGPQAHPQPAHVVARGCRRREHQEVGPARAGDLQHDDRAVREVHDRRLDRGGTAIDSDDLPCIAIVSELAVSIGRACRAHPHREKSDAPGHFGAKRHTGTDHGAASRRERQHLDDPVAGDANREPPTKNCHAARPRAPRRPDIITACGRSGRGAGRCLCTR